MHLMEMPTPEDVLEAAEQARNESRHYVRFEIPPRSKFMIRFVRIWDGVLVRVVGRRFYTDGVDNAMLVAAVIVETHPTDIIEAVRRYRQRANDHFAAPLAVNQTQANRVSMNR